jgi:uncharacterized protein (TIGR03437 family)
MNLPAFKSHSAQAFIALFALTTFAGTMQATNLLTATPSSITLACNTATGPGLAATVIVKPVTALTGASTLSVTVGSLTGGLVVTAPSVTVLSTANQVAGLTYSVRIASGCVGASTGAPAFRFSSGGVADVTITANTTVTATTSGLVAAPSPVTVTCTRTSAPVYTPGPAQTVSVTSPAAGGTPFTVDTVTIAPPAWLVVTPTSGGTASPSPLTFTVAAAAGCGAFAAGTNNTATLHLLNTPAPDKLVAVTLQVLAPSPLVALPSPASLSYTKGSGSAGHVDVNVTSAASPAPFFAVDTATLPIWLTVDAITGTAPKGLRFTSTSVADTLSPGTYSATVYLKVSGFAGLPVPISLLVTNKAPRLTVAEGTTRNISWVLGASLPTPVITAVSSDSPLAYSITTGGTLAPVVSSSQQKGLAYNFGTQIAVSFNPLIFASAQPGSVLTGTVTLTSGSPVSTIVVTFNVTILSPGSTVSGITPASLPTASAGQIFTVVLTGTGFVPSTDASQKTKVGVVVSGVLIADTNISANIINPSNIILTITVPVVADANLPFSLAGVGGAVNIGVCNPVGGTCSIPTGSATLSIGSNPIIEAVTSASSYTQVTPPAVQTLAPFDMISIFGSNFCSSGGTGCSSSQVLYGSPDPVAFRYPASLSPDATGSTQRSLAVIFRTHATPAVAIASAPLLFATNNQINVLVPGAVSAQIGNAIDIVVSFGYGSGATMKSSAPFPVTIAATNPGIFTVGANGQGDGAILNSNWTVISGNNAGGMRSTAADSDTVQFYVTGLGTPDSTASNGSAGGGSVWSTDCVSISSFLASLNAQTSGSYTSLDGTVIQSSLLNTNRLIPCVATSSANVPTVTVGGVNAPVSYAGWVADTIAGLYQLNVKLPGSAAGPFTTASGATISTLTAPVQLPVVITANGQTSQAGVTMWVTPRLKVAGPTGAGLTGTVGVAWSGSSNLVAATEGTAPYRYAVTSGLLPSGLTLSATTGAISGSPAANTDGAYIVTVTATDSANVPVTGTVTFTVTVAGGLVVSTSGPAPYLATFGSASATLTTAQASGGEYPYNYAITSPSPLPTGMTINSATGVIGTTALTPAGTYNVTVLATDSTSGTPLTGSITFSVNVALQISRTAPVSRANGVAGAISTVTATGATGTITYTLDATTAALGWVTINASTGAVAVTGSSVAGVVNAVVTATDGTAAPGAATAGTATISVTVTIT